MSEGFEVRVYNRRNGSLGRKNKRETAHRRDEADLVSITYKAAIPLGFIYLLATFISVA
jgi:hypothetical protein